MMRMAFERSRSIERITALLVLLVGTPAIGQVVNQITNISPDSAVGGTNVTAMFYLDDDTPPAPPAGILPVSVMIGSITGTSLAHPSQYLVTADFQIPTEEPVGPKDATVTFLTPSSNTVDFTSSGGFTVTVGPDTPPSVLQDPESQIVQPGNAVTFSVSALGTDPLFYQWQKDTVGIAGATNASHVIASAVDGDEGDFRCIVSNAFGAATSAVATLTVTDVLPYSGYNLFSPHADTNTYLMDNHDTIVNRWSSDYGPGLSMYLLDDGALLRAAKTASSSFNAGGTAGRVERYDWDGNLVWAFDYDTASHRSHHDIEALPNGNILMIAWELKTQAEALDAGRNPSLLTQTNLWPDTVIEVAPTGTYGGEIVWEWHVWDHLVQDYSAAKTNYGVVADHPELVDLNYVMSGPQGGGVDWNHVNAIDYSEDLDQIILSVRSFSEIWVIDHSATTAETAGHTGGNSGVGGDLLYRWGNPQAYDAGGSGDQQFFVQHDARWIEEGLPGAGNILVFNNGQGRTGGDYSSVDEIVTPVNSSGSYTGGVPYSPSAPIWSYTSSPASTFYASHISGAQRLPNGSTLICEGTEGYVFEISTNSETETKLHDASESEAYAYDSAYRLTDFNRPSGTAPAQSNWMFDAANNAGTVAGTSSATYTNTSKNEIYSCNGALLSHDANSNTGDDLVHAYVYDALNRVINVRNSTSGVLIATYVYDALGRRMKKTVSNLGSLNTTSEFVHGSRSIATYESNRLDQEYVRDGSRVIAENQNLNGDSDTTDPGDAAFYLHHNVLGSVFALTDLAGVIKEAYRYSAYGVPTVYEHGANGKVDFGGDDVITKDGQSGVNNRYQFTGLRRDPETRNFLRERYVNPALGRYLSPGTVDPWANPKQLGNAKTYARNNPVNQLGLSTIADIGGLMAGILPLDPGSSVGSSFPLSPGDGHLAERLAWGHTKGDWSSPSGQFDAIEASQAMNFAFEIGLEDIDAIQQFQVSSFAFGAEVWEGMPVVRIREPLGHLPRDDTGHLSRKVMRIPAPLGMTVRLRRNTDVVKKPRFEGREGWEPTEGGSRARTPGRIVMLLELREARIRPRVRLRKRSMATVFQYDLVGNVPGID